MLKQASVEADYQRQLAALAGTDEVAVVQRQRVTQRDWRPSAIEKPVAFARNERGAVTRPILRVTVPRAKSTSKVVPERGTCTSSSNSA